jgi:hypothetical protein
MAAKGNNPGPEDLVRLKSALPDLSMENVTLVWDFARYLLRVQTRLEELEKPRTN